MASSDPTTCVNGSMTIHPRIGMAITISTRLRRMAETTGDVGRVGDHSLTMIVADTSANSLHTSRPPMTSPMPETFCAGSKVAVSRDRSRPTPSPRTRIRRRFMLFHRRDYSARVSPLILPDLAARRAHRSAVMAHGGERAGSTSWPFSYLPKKDDRTPAPYRPSRPPPAASHTSREPIGSYGVIGVLL